MSGAPLIPTGALESTSSSASAPPPGTDTGSGAVSGSPLRVSTAASKGRESKAVFMSPAGGVRPPPGLDAPSAIAGEELSAAGVSHADSSLLLPKFESVDSLLEYSQAPSGLLASAIDSDACSSHCEEDPPKDPFAPVALQTCTFRQPPPPPPPPSNNPLPVLFVVMEKFSRQSIPCLCQILGSHPSLPPLNQPVLHL